MAVIAAAALAFACHGALTSPRADLAATLPMMWAALAIGALGALDDLIDVGARSKLLAGALTAAIAAAVTLPIDALPLIYGLRAPLAPLVAIAGATLWLVTAANAVNFVDGADGLAPGAMTIAFVALALGAAHVGDAPVAAAAATVAAALVGFLPWNLRGRLFLGDAGALFLGFLFAALHLAAATRRDGPPLALYFGPLALLPILTDVLLTLARRARSGEPLFEAHRQHLYQRWLAATGRAHLAVARRGWALMTLAAGVALLAAVYPDAQGALLVGAVVLATIAWGRVGRRLKITPRG